MSTNNLHHSKSVAHSYARTVLQRENAFLIQSKNDERYQAKPDELFFDIMDSDPYHTEFFDVEETSPVPVIRMV
jgi:hypothetical protein